MAAEGAGSMCAVEPAALLGVCQAGRRRGGRGAERREEGAPSPVSSVSCMISNSTRNTIQTPLGHIAPSHTRIITSRVHSLLLSAAAASAIGDGSIAS